MPCARGCAVRAPHDGVTAALPVPDEDFRPPVNAECLGRHSLCGSDAALGSSWGHSTTCLIREPLAALSASCTSAVPPARYPRGEACVVYVYSLSAVVRWGQGPGLRRRSSRSASGAPADAARAGPTGGRLGLRRG